ncbi:hypothetical protein JQ604_15925 [Bradyrhizobium jicamae]|uniref:hypothetical protein n=1 Tax=Bradyrhizobium jicamae TaxID=280332 RepID=UPI001BA800E2|nr:hypothetical protein [Bradyrhizobium jicamae]MBR0753677.1 hypothetical protein [Bradyrhizobium jicamae]
MTPDQADHAAPRNVFLFSGHMIDAPGRAHPRFPADKEPIAREAIARTLAEEGAGPGDLAICGGACGGDLIFAEAALARGLALELYIPFEVPTFLTESVDFAGASWRQRFLTARSQATLYVMSEELGPLPAGQNAYERDNLWMLAAATRFGAEKLGFICLWNGEGSDGPGGTKHLLEQARAMTGRVYWLDTRKLWR